VPVDVVVLRTLEPEGGADVKLLELVVLALVEREDVSDDIPKVLLLVLVVREDVVVVSVVEFGGEELREELREELGRAEELGEDDGALETSAVEVVIVAVSVVELGGEASEDAYDDAPEDCELVEVISLAAVVLEGGADVKILDLVVLVLVVRKDADAVENVIKDT
jgi:hypothetical protein